MNGDQEWSRGNLLTYRAVQREVEGQWRGDLEKYGICHTMWDRHFFKRNGDGSKAELTGWESRKSELYFKFKEILLSFKTMRANSAPLTVAVDTLDQRQPGAGATLLLIIRNTLIQANQLPVVTTGLVTRHRLHQVRAVSRSSCWLVGDPSSSQFKTCIVATE